MTHLEAYDLGYKDGLEGNLNGQGKGYDELNEYLEGRFGNNLIGRSEFVFAFERGNKSGEKEYDKENGDLKFSYKYGRSLADRKLSIVLEGIERGRPVRSIAQDLYISEDAYQLSDSGFKEFLRGFKDVVAENSGEFFCPVCNNEIDWVHGYDDGEDGEAAPLMTYDSGDEVVCPYCDALLLWQSRQLKEVRPSEWSKSLRRKVRTESLWGW